MVRTQIYLTEAQRQQLRSLSSQTGRKQSELIREAIDSYVTSAKSADYLTLVRKGVGLWEGRVDLPNFEALRQEFDRNSHG